MEVDVFVRAKCTKQTTERCSLRRTIHRTLALCLKTGKQGAALVMEALEMTGGKQCHAKELGIKLARMHDHNRILIESGDARAQRRFGFAITTFCGAIPLDNSWKDDWISFYTQNRIELQVKMVETKYGDRQVRELWTQLEKKVPKFFQGIQIVPALLHGDLWFGNKAELANESVIFDPGSFFGHAEFEFGIMQMFGGFSREFYEGYYSVRPKENGFERRCNLYELFHQLNHWNHFGSGYKGSTIGLLKRLLAE
ncbi:ketosamine-3-kinase-like isoform X2 [Varroa destructor]|uniref:protein-ribulosamine 3-kinase n=1 Tax=Varroa destructor TaxID=109461 RepID=A0A7M7KYQ7_VARDE|nr:ketosamine-3-kinase-like isoform X2 [Varroa destructor]